MEGRDVLVPARRARMRLGGHAAFERDLLLFGHLHGLLFTVLGEHDPQHLDHAGSRVVGQFVADRDGGAAGRGSRHFGSDVGPLITGAVLGFDDHEPLLRRSDGLGKF